MNFISLGALIRNAYASSMKVPETLLWDNALIGSGYVQYFKVCVLNPTD